MGFAAAQLWTWDLWSTFRHHRILARISKVQNLDMLKHSTFLQSVCMFSWPTNAWLPKKKVNLCEDAALGILDCWFHLPLTRHARMTGCSSSMVNEVKKGT